MVAGHMRRRTVLASVSTSVGLAGCAGLTGSDDSSATGTPDETERTLSADAVRFRTALRYRQNDDSLVVAEPERDQFVAVEVPERTGYPDAYDCEFALDGERFFHVTDRDGFRVDYRAGEGGTLWYDVPASDADRAALVAGGTRHPVPAAERSKFSRLPDLSLSALDVPESVDGGTFRVVISAENDGDRAGEFLAGVNRAGRFERLSVEVAPGETASTTTRLDVTADSGETERFGFVYPGGFRNVTVPVE